MDVNGVRIEDTFAEAFPMRAARIIITAVNERWAREAALKLTGFATSVIACKCEAAIERQLSPTETPDGRPGISALRSVTRGRSAATARREARSPDSSRTARLRSGRSNRRGRG